MKNRLKKFLKRIYKIRKKYGDQPTLEIKEASRYKRIINPDN